jgi:chromosome segregation ATPase
LPSPPVPHSNASPSQTLESLTQELDRVNRETSELVSQLETEEDKNRLEITKLDSELEDLRTRKKGDEDSKASIKAETKTLEEQKRSVDAMKSRLDRTLRGLQDDLAKLEEEASNRLRDLAEREQALADLCDQTALAERKVIESQTDGKEGLMEVQRQITAFEESNRVLAQRITFMKGQAEAWDSEEEKTRLKRIDEHEDKEDQKVDEEWVKSQRRLRARQEEVKSQIDAVCNFTEFTHL